MAEAKRAADGRTAGVRELVKLGFPWATFDPFLFCVHHDDAYPQGDEAMGPKGGVAGRSIGSDFSRKDGWSMYHGSIVPGFPRHPHRGFETITLVRRGHIDHSDSLGATARFGHGDVQWMTAGRGIEHAEMFPLLETAKSNPTELFQIWLNLPSADKMVDPFFTMFWHEDIPKPEFEDEQGHKTRLAVVAGSIGRHKAPPPPPSSWASRREGGIAIWTITMEPGATWELPPGPQDVHRTLYLFSGQRVHVAGTELKPGFAARLAPELPLQLRNAEVPAQMLMLQGRPIGEPVVQHGPFVMNNELEIRQAFYDYQRTRFGRWPWSKDDPVHERSAGRFAVHIDGRRETPRGG